MRFWCLVCFVVLPLIVLGDRGPRPQLTASRVVPLSATVSSEYYEYVSTSLEFDQDIYVNDPMVCGGQDEDCVPTNCEPCDWSGESPTGCDNPRCCGAAQWPQFPASNHTNDWCDSSLPSYTTLDFNQTSDEVTLAKGENAYYRFFVGEEHYCRSIHVDVATKRGDVSLSISNLVAYPDLENLKRIENGQQFEAGSLNLVNPSIYYAQSVHTICPNVNPTYERGTFSIAISGFQESNVATVTIYLGGERYPIAPPEDRISCADVPDDVYHEPPFVRTGYFWEGNACLEEGVTSDIVIGTRGWYDMILPIRPGCREVSFTMNGFTNTETDPTSLPDARNFLHCGISGDPNLADSAASLINRYKSGGGTFYISACFEEVTYLHCYPNNVVFQPGNAKFYWSSEVEPVRHKLSEANPAMLSTYYGRNQAGGLLRELKYLGYLDWGLYQWSWLTQPTTDPLVFYPPDADSSYNFTQDPLDLYLEAGIVETKSNLLNIVDVTTIGDEELRSRDVLLENGFIFVMGITSATGMPIELCNDDDLNNGSCERGSPLADEDSWTDFLTTRTFSSMNIVTEPKCNGDHYNRQISLVQSQVSSSLRSSNFGVLAQNLYLVDLYNAALTRQGCVLTMERALDTKVDNITKVQKSECPYSPDVTEWSYDPCCYIRAEAAYCCDLTTVYLEDELYFVEEEPDESELSCQYSDCDESFFTDIATSLNAVNNPLTGCASGLQDPEYELRVLIEKEMNKLVRPCLVSSGYGDTFDGVPCEKQEDCDFLSTSCDLLKGICRAKSTQEIREEYFECFFNNMSAMVEHYIRIAVLNPLDANLPRDSNYFKEAVRTAATKNDCVGLNPFDLAHGERWAANAALYCKGEGIGFSSLAEMEAEQETINEICPEWLCLGEKSCRWKNAQPCKTSKDSVGCLDTYHKLIPSSEAACPTNEMDCSITSTLSSDCDGEEYHCVACLSEWDSCTIVEGVTTEEDCAELVACEVPGGGIRYDLTAEQCFNFGECSSLCDGQSCRSVDGKKGVCVVEGAMSNCEELGGVEFDGECLLEEIETIYECDQASIELSLVTEWYMCETMDVSECQDHVNFTAPYKHLRCFVDMFRDCENESECLATGTCSDIEVAKNVVSDSSGWFSVSYGTCLTSGLFGSRNTDEPYCLDFLGELQAPYGCYNWGITQAYCAFLGSPSSFIRPFWTTWITPARTEETCRQEAQGRFGCALPNDYTKTFWFYAREDCECKQGTADYLYTWSPGSWEHGTPHSLTWAKKELRPKYTWEQTLSLVEMESWVQRAVEDSFVYSLKSQLVCEANYVSSSLTTLVCDCVQDSDSCFNSVIETEVGVSGACANATTILKGPPSFTTFSETSIEDLCVEATLYLIQRSWFLFSRAPPSVSFQFQERKERGVVLNKNGAEVGELIGDGSQIVFDKVDLVNHFSTCLLISEDLLDDYSEIYPRYDFGVPADGYSSIQPLGLKKIEQRREELFIYWCANISKNDLHENGVTLFPILTFENYEEEEEEFLSNRTESLLYTLAACYIFDLIICLLFVGVMIKKHSLQGNSLPIITWLGVILAIVCVFRIVFCFVYIDDGFSELSEYVVFEIPTFLLFTGVILILVLFVQLSKKNTFDFKSQDGKIWSLAFIALAFIWALFIVVTVVYSEVILEESDESVCPGRVQSNNDQIEDDTRTLSIIYYSIVIFLTILFALLFLNQSIKLFQMTKNSARRAKVFVFRLGTITVVSFILRSILFIILLASDITSDIYLFITLFLTEIVMILLISLELNKGFYQSMAGIVTTQIAGSTASRLSKGGSSSSKHGSSTRQTSSGSKNSTE